MVLVPSIAMAQESTATEAASVESPLVTADRGGWRGFEARTSLTWGFRAALSLARFSQIGTIEQSFLPFISPGLTLRLGDEYGFDTGLSYVRKGTSLDTASEDPTADYLHTPLLFSVAPRWLQWTPGVQPHLAVGGYVGTRIGDGGSISAGDPQRFDIGLAVKAGIGWRAPRGLFSPGKIIHLEVEYSHGLRNIIDTEVPRETRTIMVGLRFTFDRGGDHDGDGSLNREDGLIADSYGEDDERIGCWHTAEDLDGWQDDDGCLDIDNDGDRVADADDQCPNQTPEKPTGYAEDEDGHEDWDGCEDPDNDGDEVADKEDKCPDENYWAPLEKRDDRNFSEPDRKVLGDEANGRKGCPIEYVHFEIKQDRLRLNADSQLSRFKKRSAKELIDCNRRDPQDQSPTPSTDPTTCYSAEFAEVARFMREYYWVKIRIEGHMSQDETTGTLKRIDRDRAKLVRAHLIAQGIDQNRLTTRGRLDDVPFSEDCQPPELVNPPGARPEFVFPAGNLLDPDSLRRKQQHEQNLQDWRKKRKDHAQYQSDARRHEQCQKTAKDAEMNRRVTFVIDND